MHFIDAKELKLLLKFDTLIEGLRLAFGANNIQVPLRHHHSFNDHNTLLLMPAWQSSEYSGVKMVTVCPDNNRLGLASIQGIYYLFDSVTGTPLCTLDAATLTSIRTASASALASSYLSRSDSSTLLMVGTGNLAPYLIQAHAEVRPISKVLVYGRDFSKAEAICNKLASNALEYLPIKNIKEHIGQADIISCATLSHDPIIKGKWLVAGQHLDLVGSFKPTMREADDNAIQRSSIFVDTMEGATKESGDIVVPLKTGIIKEDHIKGDLFDLCSKRINGRSTDIEITYFKSVGHALEDLAAATLAFNQFKQQQL